MHIRLDLPDDWREPIDKQCGERSRPQYIVDLILADLPKKVASSLTPPRRRGRPPKTESD